MIIFLAGIARASEWDFRIVDLSNDFQSVHLSKVADDGKAMLDFVCRRDGARALPQGSIEVTWGQPIIEPGIHGAYSLMPLPDPVQFAADVSNVSPIFWELSGLTDGRTVSKYTGLGAVPLMIASTRVSTVTVLIQQGTHAYIRADFSMSGLKEVLPPLLTACPR